MEESTYIAEEIIYIAQGYQPFIQVPRTHISNFEVIPKRHISRLIVDLSYPVGHSVNDGIPKSLCSLSYGNVTLQSGLSLALVPKCYWQNVKHAFHILPVHLADHYLLVMSWKANIFIDTCLPFWLQSAPKLFNILSDLLLWVLEKRSITTYSPYLDDSLTMGEAGSTAFQKIFNLIKVVCQDLGIPLTLEKLENSSQCLTWVGIILDTQCMEAKLKLLLYAFAINCHHG